ncbi:M23 family metallopeptidase [Rothia sp. LK2588]|uniref:murein hydrolase activator EnvC n=1 Tax=Rothia sp. LK2588 TaxID=3114369 RepID=UPI0034D01B42
MFLRMRWVLIAMVFAATGVLPNAGAPPSFAADRSGWVRPIDGELHVLRGFDKPAQRWDEGHRGVDLAAPTPEVRSPAAGTVVFVGKVVDRTVVTVEHGDGKRSTFEPVTPRVMRGDKVSAGQIIATVAEKPQHCQQSCVHWGVYENRGKAKTYLNPLALLGAEGPSILLPVGSDFSA